MSNRNRRIKMRKRLVCHHEGETAAKTPYHCMHKLVNAYAIKKTTLGGGRFESEEVMENDY